MKGFIKHVRIGLLSVLLLAGCKATKYVPEGDLLYTGSNIQIQSDESKRFLRKVKSDLQDQIKPKPNSKIFGLPLKLNFYSFLNKPKKEKGLKYNLRTKFGQPPVLFSTVSPSFTQKALTAAMYNKGFFDAEVTYHVEKNEKRKRISVEYIVKAGKCYRFDSYTINIKDTVIARLIRESGDASKIKVEKRYNLNKLRNERERIDDLLKNNGYYHFNPDYLVFQADTSGTRAAVTTQLKMKPETPDKAFRRYRMSQVNVILDSSYAARYTELTTDTITIERVHLKLDKNFNPTPIAQYVYLKQGDYYSKEGRQQTISRLMGMSLFKYVDLELEEIDSTHLNAYIHLSPLPKKSISVEVDMVSKSNNFIGPGISLNYTNKNLFKGGEKLTIGFSGSIETQLNGQFKGLYTYEFGPNASLSIPRFITPFHIKGSSYFTPNTIITSSYTFLSRVNFFDMRNFQASFGYKWKESLPIEHYLRPINISYFNIRNISSDFTQLLEQNPALERRYESQLIAGVMYSYTYNQQVFPRKKNQFYFNGNVDVAGNILSVYNSFTGLRENGTGSKTVANVVYAQYARFDIDLRDHYKLTRQTVFASHMVLGVGVPYGNSTALPFTKSFFSGGTNSLRGFPVNSVGPGTYRLADSLQSSFFVQQGGDIKLEWSAEYRFPIVSIMKGALFVDAGNVWLFNKNPLLPGGEFKFEKLFTGLAADIGFGLRADLNFFVIRLDLATPVRKPWFPEGEKWVLDNVSLGDRNWRRENLILNIGIGYPF